MRALPSTEYMDAPPEDIRFVIGVTDLQELAEKHGFEYAVSPDGLQERVIRPDGTVAIDVRYPPTQPPKKPAPSVWLRAKRFHTYDGHPKMEGEVYLAREEDVENILSQRLAEREAGPRKALRQNVTATQPQTPVANPVEAMTVDTAPALVPAAKRRGRPPKAKP